MSQVYYWKGFSGDGALLKEHHETILKLLQRDYAPADLEKLRGSSKIPLYSFRLNKANRLLFTTRTVNGQHYLHLLELILNHDYQKSRFVKPQVLRDHLEQQDSTIEIAFDPIFDPINDNEKPFFDETNTSTLESTEFIPLDYFNQQFIQLRDEQENVINQPLPLIVNGVAGSGKTYIALTFLTQFIDSQNIDDGTVKRMLYVTIEPALVTAVKQHWTELSTKTPGNITVDFLTYNELLAQQQKSFDPQSTSNHYQEWLGNQKNTKAEFTDETQFQEFQICAVHTKEKYLTLGEHQSSIPPEKREQLYQKHQSFQAYLTDKNVIDPPFYALNAQPTYDLIVVDEAQNFSLQQLQNMHQLARNEAILYCMDPQQNLKSPSPTRILLQQLHWNGAEKLPFITLNRTYRCAKNITKVVNALLSAKQAILGKVDKQEAAQLSGHGDNPESGFVAVTSPNNLTNYHNILERRTSNHFAVITHQDLKEEARATFNTPLVFTVEQIQGLEYHTIVVYRLLSDTDSQKILKEINPALINRHENRAKQKKQDSKYLAPWFNSLYTAYTRAKNTLLICENREKKNANELLNILQEVISGSASNLPNQGNFNIPETDWAAEEARQRKQGNTEVADEIRNRQLFHNSKEPVKSTTSTTITPISAINPPAQKKLNKKKSPSNKLTEAQTKAQATLATFSETGVISRLVNSPDCLEILFDAPFTFENNNASLFQHIINSTEKARRFAVITGLPAVNEKFIIKAIACPDLPEDIIRKLIEKILLHETASLETNQILMWMKKYLTPDRLDSTFLTVYYKSRNQDKALHCVTLMQSILNYNLLNSSVSKQEAFLENLMVSKAEGEMPSAHSLVVLPEGRQALKKLINAQDPILHATVAERSRSECNSLLHFLVLLLALTPANHKVLEELIDHHPDIMSALPGEALSWVRKPRPDLSGAITEATPLYMLASQDGGQEILFKLIKNYPNMINNMPAKGWTLAMTSQAGTHATLSPLYWICTDSDSKGSSPGLKILNQLIDFHPDIMKHMPAKGFGLARTSHCNQIKNLTPLFNLTFTSNSRAILRKLIDKYPEIIKNIPLEAWDGAPNNQADVTPFIASPLDCLNRTPDGQALITDLVRLSPDIRDIVIKKFGTQYCTTTFSFFEGKNKEDENINPSKHDHVI